MNIFLLFRRWGLLVFCAMLLASRALADGQAENRFLIIVDTASAMRRFSDGTEQAITELIQSNMKGQFRPGDTIGFWTYNDRLHTEFPMQIWTGTNSARIQEAVLGFLREQHYEK